MKIIENDSKQTSIVNKSFRGLCRDRFGDVWWFTGHKEMAFVVLSTESSDYGYSEDIDSAIELYGPFTKYNGSITMEND